MALVWTPLIASPRDVGPSMLQCPGGIQRPEQSKVSEKKACCTKRIQKVGPPFQQLTLNLRLGT